MVWKRLIVVVVALAIISTVSINASAAEVYNEGNISTTYVTYFRDMLSKVSPSDDYVFYRSGQYEYSMVVGDLDYSNGRISFNYIDEPCKVYKITQSTGSSYNQTYSFTVTNYSDFSLNVGNSLIYSNLGDFPDLIERGDYLETALVLLVLVVVCMYITSRIFGFCLRTRRS